MASLQLIAASVAFAAGGLFMKQSAGMTRLLPTCAFLTLFLIGASLQALGMRHADMGASYVFVLGLEAVAALAFSAYVLGESYSASRLAAAALVLVGIAWLRRA